MSYNFKKHLEELERKRMGVHPDPGSNIFLHRNERIIPYEDSVLEGLSQRLKKLHLHLYPDLELFYGKLSQWLGISEEQIFVTEGVSGAIKSLIETIAGQGDNIIFPSPTFALYPVYCNMYNLEYKTVGYTENYRLDIDGLLRKIDKNTAIVFLPNPNVPIEGTIGLDEISSIAKYCADNNAFLVLDEVYFPFGGPTAVELMKSFDNIFVMRSFSKAFGLAGVRVGYLLGSAKNVEYVSKVRTGYETNSISAEIVSFFIDNYSIVEEYIDDTKEGLNYLKGEFSRKGLEYTGGDCSNFIFVNMRNEDIVKKIDAGLKSKNIYIRGGWPEPYSGGFLVTGGPKYIMEKFTKELWSCMDR